MFDRNWNGIEIYKERKQILLEVSTLLLVQKEVGKLC